MSRNISSAHDNPSHYNRLVRTGAIGSLKRDILLEASVDLWFVDHVRSYFARENGGSDENVIPCTVRLIRELVATDMARLATCGKGGAHVSVQKTDEELLALVENLSAHAFEYFLAATEPGVDWVAQYKRLVSELG